MAIVNNETYNIYEQLEYNFLYEKDVNSIHILLNLYDLDKNIKNIYPRYTSLNKLIKDVEKIIDYKADKENICKKLGSVIHEDINRLELYTCLEGYIKGYFDKDTADKLEKFTIENLDMEKIYNKEHLYHFTDLGSDIRISKNELFNKLSKSNEIKELEDLVNSYSSNLIEPKIKSINSYFTESEILNSEDIKSILDRIASLIFNNIRKIYKELYWYGLNDRVLKRYR